MPQVHAASHPTCLLFV